METTRIGSKPSGKGPEDWFARNVRIDPFFDADEGFSIYCRCSDVS